MQTIHITVRNKFAVCTEPEAIVANNTDWRVEFDLDSEWNNATTKYCRFYYNDYKYDKPMYESNICNAPSYSEYMQNDGPEPYYIGIALYSLDVDSYSTVTTSYTDPIMTNIIYIKCIPSLKETGAIGAYNLDFKNKLYMSTDDLSKSHDGNPGWRSPWSASEVSNHIHIETLNGDINSLLNSVTIELNDRELKEIEIPVNLYEQIDQGGSLVDGYNLDDMQWDKDYIFSYQLDYGYNCAYWWTYEINKQAIWKSPVQAVMNFGDKMTGNGSETVCLLPTNKESNRNTKRLVLHIIGSFGNTFMSGAKLRFVNLRVREVNDIDSIIPPTRISQSNYISTNSHHTDLHKWLLGKHTQLCSSFISEDEWVILNEFKSKNSTSYLTHYIYPSLGNSLFVQNDFDSRNWTLSCKIFNTSQTEDIVGWIIGQREDTLFYLANPDSGIYAPHSQITEIQVPLNYINPPAWRDGHWISRRLPTAFDHIWIQFMGGNDGNNTIIIEDLKLIDNDNNGVYPVERVNLDDISSTESGDLGTYSAISGYPNSL